MRSLRSRAVALTAVAAAVLGGLTLAGPVSAATRTPPSWHRSLTLSTPDFPEFSAATSWTANGAWAFASQDSTSAPHAFKLSGGAWHRDLTFPGLRGEQISSATSSSASNVWVFTITQSSKERVLRYDGHAWSVVPTSGKLINSGLALSSRDVWIFGAKLGFSTGTVHYNGTSFRHFASGAGLFGGSALSSTSIWAYGVDKVAHWNGTTWKSTPVSGLLSTSCGFPGFLEGILAISRTDVIAVGAGGCASNRGPLILLRFNGMRWHRLTISKPINAFPVSISGDGSGGAWIPVLTGVAEPSSSLYHFTGPTIGKAVLPLASKTLEIDGVTIAGDGTKALAFGLTHNSADTHADGVVLRFEP